MAFDESELDKIAALARIRVRSDRREALAHDLAQILGWVAQLNEVNTEGVEPLANVAQTRLRLRPDEVTEQDVRPQILDNAPVTIGPYFAVPKVID
jgi:aspartyl-tRNA(Asn)/glutamyl-tRNA(Gln) amidotransferase subunit C